MSDLRLVVTGAGGRMGRMLVKAIHEHEGVVLSGALERPGSDLLEQDAGILAGIGPIGVPVTSDALALIVEADGIVDFSTPAATVALSVLSAQARVAHVIGTTGLSGPDIARLAAGVEKSTIPWPAITPPSCAPAT